MIDVTIYIILLAAGALMAFAAFRDFKHRIIDNKITVALAGVFIVYALVRLIAGSFGIETIATSLIAGFIILVACFLLFQANMLGGGDAKFAAALALFAGIEFMPAFLVIVAIAGGLVAFATWMVTKIKDQKDGKKPEVPYGIALSIGGMWVLSQHYQSVI